MAQYKSQYTGEEIDEAIGEVKCGSFLTRNITGEITLKNAGGTQSAKLSGTGLNSDSNSTETIGISSTNGKGIQLSAIGDGDNVKVRSKGGLSVFAGDNAASATTPTFEVKPYGTVEVNGKLLGTGGITTAIDGGAITLDGATQDEYYSLDVSYNEIMFNGPDDSVGLRIQKYSFIEESVLAFLPIRGVYVVGVKTVVDDPDNYNMQNRFAASVGYVREAIGDINAVLDQINGEVV